MPDPIFANPRLVEIYDHFDGQRDDLVHYIAIARELQAKHVLDIGSGTGCFAHLLRNSGFTVTAIEPALASLNFARRKPNADQIHWIHGDASKIPALGADLAVMTGNVAQVFIEDTAWYENLSNIRRGLRPGGHLVFEARDPAQKAWLEWTPEKTLTTKYLPGIGQVRAWCNVQEASEDEVSFRWSYEFSHDGALLTSDSCLRFRNRAALELSLHKSGYQILEVRDAPDRPGKEFVFIATYA